MLGLCDCGKAYYGDGQYTTCYDCYLERRSSYVECIFCGRWHGPKYSSCFTCRRESPAREEAGRDLRLEILLRDQYTCRYCGTSEGAMQVDHVKPCARGGTADPWNLQTLCADCNRWKGSSWFPGSRHDDARIRLMHAYFTFGWALLSEQQRETLNHDADEYGALFDFRSRRKPYLVRHREAA